MYIKVRQKSYRGNKQEEMKLVCWNGCHTF